MARGYVCNMSKHRHKARHAQRRLRMLEIVDLRILGTLAAGGIFFGILGCLMVGRWLGRRAIARHGAAGVPNISSLEAAVFALLGLLIAFTFSGALSLLRRTAPPGGG